MNKTYTLQLLFYIPCNKQHLVCILEKVDAFCNSCHCTIIFYFLSMFDVENVTLLLLLFNCIIMSRKKNIYAMK